MLNFYLNKYNYYNCVNIKLKTPHHNKKLIKKLKIYYKKLKINLVFLKKQKIINYNAINIQKYFFLKNANILKPKKQKIIIYNNEFLYKNDLILKIYTDLYNFNDRHKVVNFKNYWLFNVFFLIKKINSFYFVNNLKFFTNQRLIKQSILINYTNTKKIKYNNYIKFFKYNINNKNNLIFFFKLNNYYYNGNNFFKYKIYLKKYIYKNSLILMLI